MLWGGGMKSLRMRGTGGSSGGERTEIWGRWGVISTAPRQSEICVKFSVFHTVFDVKLW